VYSGEIAFLVTLIVLLLPLLGARLLYRRLTGDTSVPAEPDPLEHARLLERWAPAGVGLVMTVGGAFAALGADDFGLFMFLAAFGALISLAGFIHGLRSPARREGALLVPPTLTRREGLALAGFRWPDRCLLCRSALPDTTFSIDLRRGLNLLVVSFETEMTLEGPACAPCFARRKRARPRYHVLVLAAMLAIAAGSVLVAKAFGQQGEDAFAFAVFPFLAGAWFWNARAERFFDWRFVGLRAGLEPDLEHFWLDARDPALLDEVDLVAPAQNTPFG
jgi:hypothetical protein